MLPPRPILRPPSGDSPLRHAVHLARILTGLGRRRTAAVLGLMAAGAFLEGAGLLLLVPVLELLGVGTAGGPAAPATHRLVGGLTLYVGLVAVAAAIVRLRTVAASTLRLDCIDRLRQELHSAVMMMEYTAFQGLRAGEIKQVLTGEIGRIGVAVEALLTMAVVLATAPVLLAAAFWLSPPLTFGTLAVAVVALAATRGLGRRGFALGRRLGEASRAMMADLTDDLAGFAVIRTLGAEPRRLTLLADRFAAIRAAQRDHTKVQATERALLQVGAAAAASLILLLAVEGLSMPLAGALVLVLAQARLLAMLLRGLTSWRQATGVLPALQTYRAWLESCRAAAEPVDPDSPPPRLGRAIVLDGVSVDHGAERPALDGVRAEIPAGRITALIGHSGAGKSTVAELLAGLRRPGAGRILIDDEPLVPSLLRPWRGTVGLVPQDAFLLHDTVRANLALARPDADDATMRAALADAAALDFVDRLPQGLDTPVGDRGSRLSGGERQRLALARALLRQPALLILDEATAALDAETERIVLEALHRIRGRTTIIIVAHRPSTVRMADHVIALEAGRLLATGDWTAVRAAVGARLAELDMVG